jgi:hypothetical protein
MAVGGWRLAGGELHRIRRGKNCAGCNVVANQRLFGIFDLVGGRCEECQQPRIRDLPCLDGYT